MPATIFVRKSHIQERYKGVSPTWIVRQQKAHGFPMPTMYIGASPFWSIDALDAWDAAQALKPRPEPIRDMAAVRAARHHRVQS